MRASYLFQSAAAATQTNAIAPHASAASISTHLINAYSSIIPGHSFRSYHSGQLIRMDCPHFGLYPQHLFPHVLQSGRLVTLI